MVVKRLSLEGAGELHDERDASACDRMPTHLAATDHVACVLRARSGDPAAQEALFRRHVSPIRRKLLRLLGPDADIEDLTQETFVSAFENLHKLVDAEAFAGWLHTIAVHAVRRRLRRRSLLRTLGFVRWGEHVAHIESVAVPGLATDALAEARIAYASLSRLSIETRVAFLLRHVEGLTIPEIAAQMAISERTVKRRVAAAQTELAKSLELVGTEELE